MLGLELYGLEMQHLSKDNKDVGYVVKEGGTIWADVSNSKRCET